MGDESTHEDEWVTLPERHHRYLRVEPVRGVHDILTVGGGHPRSRPVNRGRSEQVRVDGGKTVRDRDFKGKNVSSLGSVSLLLINRLPLCRWDIPRFSTTGLYEYHSTPLVSSDLPLGHTGTGVVPPSRLPCLDRLGSCVKDNQN